VHISQQVGLMAGQLFQVADSIDDKVLSMERILGAVQDDLLPQILAVKERQAQSLATSAVATELVVAEPVLMEHDMKLSGDIADSCDIIDTVNHGLLKQLQMHLSI